MKLSKKDIAAIISFYSIKKNEFLCIDEDNLIFEHTSIKGYWITLKSELGNDIVTVSHSNSNGKIVFFDTWSKEHEKYIFEGRNLPSEMTKEENLQLRTYIQKCYELRDKNIMLEKKAEDFDKYYFENKKLKEEIKFLKSELKHINNKNDITYQNEKYKKLEKEYELIKSKYERIGRPSILSARDMEKFQESIRNNETTQEICKKFGISRATYFRLKKNTKKDE